MAGPGPAPTSPRARLATGFLAGALFLAVWTPLQPERAILPTSDLYTHLTVARHLARGEGFLTDVAYPLSFAYPFARRLPQPLVHRPPGFGAMLVLPYLTAGGDPGRTIAHARGLAAVLLAATAGLGAWGLARRGRGRGVPAWLILVGASPLLSFAVGWVHDEIAAGLLMLAAWLILRTAAAPRPVPLGLAAGLLALVRPELAWAPLLWWLVLAGRGRGFWLALATLLVVTAPWSLRNLRVTGQPLFSLQAVAEHAKDTRTHPGYAVYRSLEPRPLLRTLREDPEPLARKTVRGLRFYRDELPRLLPWPWLLLLAASPVLHLARRRPVQPRSGEDSPPRPGLPLATATLALTCLLYAPFDHGLRHLVPLLPVLCWELSALLARSGPAGTARREIAGAAGAAALVLVIAVLLPCRLPGWSGAAAEASRLEPEIARAAASARTAPPGPLFSEHAAVPWFADRPAVWTPASPEIAERIAGMLAQDPANSP